jgi:hypothetical protein
MNKKIFGSAPAKEQAGTALFAAIFCKRTGKRIFATIAHAKNSCNKN